MGEFPKNMDTHDQIYVTERCDPSKLTSQSVILTEEYLCLAVEDHVSYPLPEFARLLPDNPCTEIVHVRGLDCLRRVTLRSSCDNIILFTFVDESNEIVIDANVDYYSVSDKKASRLCPMSRDQVELVDSKRLRSRQTGGSCLQTVVRVAQ